MARSVTDGRQESRASTYSLPPMRYGKFTLTLYIDFALAAKLI